MSASRSNLKIDIEAMTKISTEILIYGRYENSRIITFLAHVIYVE